MSWSVDYIRYNKDGHRFIVLNDDCSGNSLLLDLNRKDKFCLELCFGNFQEPDWSYIDPDDFTDDEKKFIDEVSKNPSWSKWNDGSIKDWFDRPEPEDIAVYVDDRWFNVEMDNQFTSIDRLKKVIMDKAITTEYIVDEPEWSYDDKVKFLQLMVAGLYTGSVVYHLDYLKNINTIYRGCNIVRTLIELFSGELHVSPSMFTPNGSVEKVKFFELPLPVKRSLSNGKLMMFRIRSNAMYGSCLKKEDFINMFSEI